MKKRSQKSFDQTVNDDLKLLFETEDPTGKLADDFVVPRITFEDAQKLFDELNLGESVRSSGVRSRWTHESVRNLRQSDPISWITEQARSLIAKAMEKGWVGPPFDPFKLAELQHINVEESENVRDASTTSDSTGRFTIRYNPAKPLARIRYSIAHEIAHTLFPDCAVAVRHRATHADMRGDEWQLETLCNIAASELLMPIGSLQMDTEVRPTVDLVIQLQRKYRVSCEAVLHRLIRLTTHACIGFVARRSPDEKSAIIEYQITSSAIRQDVTDRPTALTAGYVIRTRTALFASTTPGQKKREEATWVRRGESWYVESLMLPPSAGDVAPRTICLAFPPGSETLSCKECLRFVRGDAAAPIGIGEKLLVQLVNDKAQLWGGGLAKQVGKKWPAAQVAFRQWTFNRDEFKLGNVHIFRLQDDLQLVSLVAQHGFGKSKSGPRIRYAALFSALQQVAIKAKECNATVHLPRIGAGEAGGIWRVIEGMIRETLVAEGISVTVYDLPSAAAGFQRQSPLTGI